MTPRPHFATLVVPTNPGSMPVLNIDAFDFNAAGLAAMALVAAMIERLDPAERAALAAAAEASIGPSDPGMPTDGKIRDRTIELIRKVR
jgi:hypothetical protein